MKFFNRLIKINFFLKVQIIETNLKQVELGNNFIKIFLLDYLIEQKKQNLKIL